MLLYLVRNFTTNCIEESNSINKHQQSWKLINEITRRTTTKRAILKVRNKEERVKASHFTDSEYVQVRKKVKENRVLGPDCMSPEVLKRCEINDIIIDFTNNILINNK